MKLGTGRTPSPDESWLRADPTRGFFWPPALLTTAGCPSGFAIESITTSSHTLTLEDAPHPGGEAQPGRSGPIITLIIYFSPSTPKSARGRSIIPSVFQSCNIYSKPEPLPVNVLSEERHLLWGQCHGEIEHRGRRRQSGAQPGLRPGTWAVIIYTPCLMHSTCLGYKRRWVDWRCLPRSGPAVSVSAILLTMTK